LRLKIRSKLILSSCLVALIPLMGIMAIPLISERLVREANEENLREAVGHFNHLIFEQRSKCQEIADSIVNDPEFLKLHRTDLKYVKYGEDISQDSKIYARSKLLPGVIMRFYYNAKDFKVVSQKLPYIEPESPCLLPTSPGEDKPIHFTVFGSAPIKLDGEVAGGVIILWPLITELPYSQGRKGYHNWTDNLMRSWVGISLVNVVEPTGEVFQRILISSDPEASTHVYQDFKTEIIFTSLAVQLSSGPRTSDSIEKGNLKVKKERKFALAYVPITDADKNLLAVLILGDPLFSLRTFYTQASLYILLFAGIGTLIALLTGTYFARSISARIRLLAQGAKNVSADNLDFEVKDPVRDELGALANTFNTMTRRLKASRQELQQRAITIEEKNRILDQTVHELTRIRDFIENVLNQVGSAVLTVDLEGKITQINPACLSLFLHRETENELLGQNLDKVIVGGELLGCINEALETCTPLDHWETTETIGGNRVPLNVSISVLHSEGDIQGLVVTVRDLSIIRSLEEDVRRQEKLAALGHLSAGMAHEIRNPLGIIKGSGELLERRFAKEPEAAGLARYIIDESERLSQTLQDFLDFARPREPSLEPTDINQVISKALPLAQHHSNSDKIKLELDMQDDLPQLSLDFAQCQQVFLNLLLNAFEASSQAGVVRITSKFDESRSRVFVTISDEGDGIPPDELGNIFNPFFTTKSSGTGLGLSIVHRIIESHKGTIEVESKPGEGTTFILGFSISQQPLGASTPKQGV
jgi:PAS domain S-box-containing protein